jgi:hypothetical protein
MPAFRFFDESVKFHNPKEPAVKPEYACPALCFIVVATALTRSRVTDTATAAK